MVLQFFERMTKASKSTTTLFLILLIAVIGILVCTQYQIRVLRSDVQALSAARIISSEIKATSVSPSPVVASAVAFPLKEIGLTMQIDPALKGDLQYSVLNFGKGVFALSFSTKKIKASSSYCAVNDTPPFMSFDLYTQQMWNQLASAYSSRYSQSVDATSFVKTGEPYRIGNYIVVARNPQALCYDSKTDTKTPALIKAAAPLVKAAVMTMKAL